VGGGGAKGKKRRWVRGYGLGVRLWGVVGLGDRVGLVNQARVVN